MNDLKELLDREARRVDEAPDALESVLRRRDRKRRNQRIAAGVVGIGIFVAAIWIVTSVGSFDRTQTPAATGPADSSPTETGPAETAPSPARASAAPDVVRKGTCSGPSNSWLGLTDVGDKIRVVFRIVSSQDDPWRIVLRHGRAGPEPFNYGDGRVFFEGTRTGPWLNPEVSVRKSVGDLEGDDGFAARAVDQQTGQVCKALGVI